MQVQVSSGLQCQSQLLGHMKNRWEFGEVVALTVPSHILTAIAYKPCGSLSGPYANAGAVDVLAAKSHSDFRSLACSLEAPFGITHGNAVLPPSTASLVVRYIRTVDTR
jgi:hypothetical protein